MNAGFAATRAYRRIVFEPMDEKRSRITSRLVSAWNLLPALLAFSLLLYQMAVPWTVAHFATEDGPSHVYAAAVFGDLVLHHKTSVYSRLYTVQREPLPNWTATVALAVGELVVGTEHAEQLFLSLTLAIGFFAWCYANRAFSPEHGAWTPLANFLFQTWFLWLGFFNFCLGVALLALAIGFYVRKQGRMDTWRTGVLGLILLTVFATHLVAAGSAVAVLMTIAFWMHIAIPVATRANPNRRWCPPSPSVRQFLLLTAAAAPTIALLVLFAVDGQTPVKLDPQIAWAWATFPKHIFLTARGDAEQRLLWKAVLIYASLAALLLKKKEWASAKGGLVLATLLIFGVYLLIPDRGFGGAEAKIRFSWIFFVLAGLVACSASRLRYLRVPAAIFVAALVYSNTVQTQRTAEAVSGVLADYLSVAGRIVPHSSLVRLRYATPLLADRYHYAQIGRDPVFHADAFAAARTHSVDLSDYEALSEVFPLVFKDSVTRREELGLWGFEGPDPGSPAILRRLAESLPEPIDFVLFVGDAHTPQAERAGVASMLAYLNSAMRLVASSRDSVFRLYERRCEVVTGPPERFAGRACIP